jgi:hypothetical protein
VGRATQVCRWLLLRTVEQETHSANKEEFKQAKRQLEKLEAARKVLEAT